MVKNNITAIKKWIKSMNFELVNSHEFKDQKLKINYYILGNFGIYEEISNVKGKPDNLRFITWNPWGIDFEIQSLEELHDAYLDFICFIPEMGILKKS